MSVVERDARSFTKNADSAPALGIALPVRKRSPVEFWMHLYQMLPPLNTKIGYMIQKADEKNVVDGKLPAAARNALIERALSRDMQFLFFLDDDVLFPDITLYRMWVTLQKHREVGCITAVGGTKLTPSEPLIYQDGVQGAWWDWQLGAQVPIHSAWAGCMLVNLEYVKKMPEPWFNDVVTGVDGPPNERVKQNIWGHDRYFHKTMREQTGGIILADTGLLVAHFDADLQKSYILPPNSPPFTKPILGECFIPFFDDDGTVNWRRIIVADQPDPSFKTYLNWLQDQNKEPAPVISILNNDPPKKPLEQHEGFAVDDKRKGDFSKWLEEIGA